ncbi:Hypothetical predicted protein [Lecanosticta acicola]|uniref:Uncharacterized protein n=1 Tax=Lecanosticta acicola TaxID=111012 RepID=A0AAI8Z1K4_9PEZI|nr:Hypothetical predicted protein [Lecanosticta acicola]
MSKLHQEENALHELEIPQTKGMIVVLHQVAQDFMPGRPQLVSKTVAKKWTTEHTPAADELLSILAAVLKHEQSHVNFDLFRSHDVCRKIAAKPGKLHFAQETDYTE